MESCSDKTVLTVGQLAERINACVIGDDSRQVTGVNSLEQSGPMDVSFVTSDEHAGKFGSLKAAAVIIKEQADGISVPQLLVEDVRAALINALNIFAPKLTPVAGIHATAVVEESAKLGKDVGVGAGAYIGHNVRLGHGSIIGCGCKIGENSEVGRNSRIEANVVVYHNCRIGDNCIIQANCTIGATGFGYYFIDGEHRLIPHNGGVLIEDCVEIGANSCVDRAKFGDTIIGAGTKIDNFAQIAHNVIIGRCCVIASQFGVAGSSRLGDGIVVGGQAGVTDNVEIGSGAILAGRAGVISDIGAGETVFGLPARDIKEQLKIVAVSRRLPEMLRQLKELVKKVEKLELTEDAKK